MRRAVIYGREIVMQGSPYTFLVYRSAFKGDLFNDLVDAYEHGRPEMSAMLQFAWPWRAPTTTRFPIIRIGSGSSTPDRSRSAMPTLWG